MQATERKLELLDQIKADYSPRYTFKKSAVFSWSSSEETIYYSTSKRAAENAVFSLLHELGHAELGHKEYHDDLDLLMMEVAAWKKAKLLANRYHLVIEEEHIEDCLDSYRDWLHQRSKCVECGTHSLQTDRVTYDCYNCGTRWQVPASRMCTVRKKRL